MIAALVMAAAAPTLTAMRDHRRVLVVAASDERDPELVEQRRALTGWTRGAADRDTTVVEVVGERVHGVSDGAAALRRKLGLAPATFAVVLVGKDGHVAFRSAAPVLPAQLDEQIDAMPMRRAGLR